MDEIKVYRMNDYEWYASKWDIEKTNEWYCEQFEDNDIDDIEVSDLDNDGMWWNTVDKQDIDRLGDADEIISEIGKPKAGDLMRKGSEVYKWITFREAIQFDLDFTEPYCIACTEF